MVQGSNALAMSDHIHRHGQIRRRRPAVRWGDSKFNDTTGTLGKVNRLRDAPPNSNVGVLFVRLTGRRRGSSGILPNLSSSTFFFFMYDTRW